MIDRSNWNSYFEDRYREFFIKRDKMARLIQQRGVYQADIEDALDDPTWVVRKNTHGDPELPPGVKLDGDCFDVFCETTEGRVLKIIGRLYESGQFQVITVITNISEADMRYYYREKELIQDE
ncbi:hypothetical protein E5161_09565 [Cohnella pontilimi]|uniref:BrnT family toxin n=1 Tax=Cohnella pontilimi TaxID=2564100 RepID=A0A4U0FBT4_9BACL|nr:hypothetical protein [Cohnella pontilimi]TJY42245.1 hypothetical protein E5161_09565 [Cohnella pontilimi]